MAVRRNMFGFLTEKRETYRRDVAGERADWARGRKVAVAEEKQRHAEMADTQADIQRGFAYNTGARHKREGKRPLVSQALLSQAVKYMGAAKARALAKREYMRGYRENPSGSKARKNPVDAAASLSEAWHGRPARTRDEYVEKVKFHGVLTDLGRLRELEVRAGSKKVIPIAFDKRTRLASSENGKQLYVVGGDQSLDLDALGIPDDEADKDMVVIGPVCAVTYDAAKQHLDEEDKQMGPYRHVLGEEGGAEPLLVYDRLNDAVGFAGGTYHIDRDLDFGAHSAGIRN